MLCKLLLSLAFPGLIVSLQTHAAESQAAASTYVAPRIVDCNERLTRMPVAISSLRDAAKARAASVYTQQPQLGHRRLEVEKKKQQFADATIPQYFKEMHPQGIGAVAVPAPATKDPFTIALTNQSHTYAVHIEMPWHGQRTSTNGFIALPPTSVPNKDYEIGPEHPVAVVFKHGVGTKQASGEAVKTMAEMLAAAGIPVWAPDTEGHGAAPKSTVNLDTSDKVLDWQDALTDKVIHPRVKIIEIGHSGGAMWVHLGGLREKASGKKSRVAERLILAPGIDAAGGDLVKEAAIRALVEADLKAGRYKDIESVPDREYMTTFPQNLKISEVAQPSVAVLEYSYRVPTLTPEEERQLGKMTFVMGRGDAITVLGYEDIIAEQHKNSTIIEFINNEPPKITPSPINSPITLVWLGPGLTKESKNDTDFKNIGHTGVFERQIIVDGERVFQLYDFIVKTALAHVPANHRAEELPPALKLAMSLHNAEMNFPAFRELLQNYVTYVKRPTAQQRELLNQQSALKNYLAEVQTAEASVEKSVRPRKEAAIATARTELKITDKLSPQGAEQELNWQPLTPERTAELRNYIAAVDAIRDAEELSPQNYSDDQFEMDLETIRVQNAKVLQLLGITHIPDYKPYYEEASRNHPEWIKQNILRQAIDILHEKVVARQPVDKVLTKDKYAEAFASVGITGPENYLPIYERLAATRKEHLLKGQIRDGLTKLENAFNLVDKRRRSRQDAEVRARIALVPKPEGIDDGLAAERELTGDRSPERIKLVQDFLDKVNEEQKTIDASAAPELRSKLASIRKPSGIRTVEEAKAKYAKLTALLTETFKPGIPEIDAMAEQIASGDKKLAEWHKGIKDKLASNSELAITLNEARIKRNKNLEKWETLWNRAAKMRAENPSVAELSSALLANAKATFERRSEEYSSTHTEYRSAVLEYYDRLQKSGQWQGEHIDTFPPTAITKREAMFKAEAAYVEAKRVYEKLRWTEALNGSLTGPNDLVEAAHRLAKAVWGSDYVKTGNPSAQSLTGQLKVNQEYFDQRMKEKSELEIKLDELRADYANLMADYARQLNRPDLQVGQVYVAVPIFNFLNRSTDEVNRDLQSEDGIGALALREIHQKWVELMRLYSVEQQNLPADEWSPQTP